MDAFFLCHQWFFTESTIPDPGLAGHRLSALTTWSRLLLWCNYTYVAIFLSYFYLLMLMLLAYLSNMPMILLTYFGVPVPTLLVSLGVSIMLLLAHLVHHYRCHWNILVYVSTSIICFINSAITGIFLAININTIRYTYFGELALYCISWWYF